MNDPECKRKMQKKTYGEKMLVSKIERGNGSFANEFGVEDFGDQDVGSPSHLQTSFPDSDIRWAFSDEMDFVG